MTYEKGGVRISVETVDGFGKKPGLWVSGSGPNSMVKLASFGNQDKADKFCKILNYFFSILPDEKDICESWHTNGHGGAVCWGTKECEACDCDGYKFKCNFYPELRAGQK